MEGKRRNPNTTPQAATVLACAAAVTGLPEWVMNHIFVIGTCGPKAARFKDVYIYMCVCIYIYRNHNQKASVFGYRYRLGFRVCHDCNK